MKRTVAAMFLSGRNRRRLTYRVGTGHVLSAFGSAGLFVQADIEKRDEGRMTQPDCAQAVARQASRMISPSRNSGSISTDATPPVQQADYPDALALASSAR